MTVIDARINISLGLREQFQQCFSLQEKNGEYYMGASIGSGLGMRWLEFPGAMEFYHFKQARFHQPINMVSVNPSDSQWLLIHVNLAKIKQEKMVDGSKIEFQKYLPIGILLYGAGLEISTQIPAHVDTEVVSIRFNHAFLDAYFKDWQTIIKVDKNLVYEDLDQRLENKLKLALNAMDNKILCHAKVLDFMSQFFDKLKSHETDLACQNLRSSDINSLFLAATHLRNPLVAAIPSVQELASAAAMGVTKFKTSFKQMFGSPPMQYHHKIRMEYARDEITSKRCSPSEVSYALGYSHPSNFTVAYKQYFDVLPSSKQ